MRKRLQVIWAEGFFRLMIEAGDFNRRIKGIKRKLADALPDSLYIRLLYKKVYGRFPDLRNPRTFDEKIQWYKLYYRLPVMTRMADKFEVRAYLTQLGHSGLLNELYGVYRNADEIDISRLPDRFVIKATHGSSMNLICRNKKNLDWGECRKKLAGWLTTSHYGLGREWAYKDIRPRLICEKYLENMEAGQLIDYKFFCYNGRPEVMFVCTGRFGADGVHYDAFDMNWRKLEILKGRPPGLLAVQKPANWSAMVDAAAQLCGKFPFVRVDLYSVAEKVIFGEFTFYPDSGLCRFTPDSYNYFFGDLFSLPMAE